MIKKESGHFEEGVIFWFQLDIFNFVLDRVSLTVLKYAGQIHAS